MHADGSGGSSSGTGGSSSGSGGSSAGRSFGKKMARGEPDRARRSELGAEIARIGAREDGVISRARLRELGVSRGELRGLVARGQLHPRFPGVYAIGHGNLTKNGHLRAALLTSGAGSFLSHRGALMVHGLQAFSQKAIEVTVLAKHTPKRRGLRTHRIDREPDDGEIVERFGLRYSSLPRALIEIAPTTSVEELMRLITAAVRKRLFDKEAMTAALDRRHKCGPGLAKLRAALGRYLDPEDRTSGLELSFDVHARADARIPAYEKNVRMGGFEFDCRWSEQRVLLELDGRPYHTAIEDTERDHRKLNWAQAHGWMVCKITDLAWEHDRPAALEQLYAMLDAGATRSSASPRAAAP